MKKLLLLALTLSSAICVNAQSKERYDRNRDVRESKDNNWDNYKYVYDKSIKFSDRPICKCKSVENEFTEFKPCRICQPTMKRGCIIEENVHECEICEFNKRKMWENDKL